MQCIRITALVPVLAIAWAASHGDFAGAQDDCSPRQASTYLGGSGLDAADSITVDREGNVIVVGWTDSRDFPVPEGQAPITVNGGADVLIAKLDPSLERLLAVRTLGGTGADQAIIVGVADDGRILIAGWATAGFPTTGGALQEEVQGGTDIFVAALAGDDLDLDYSTVLGGTGDDVVFKGQVSSDGLVTMIGYTSSSNGSFPLERAYQSDWGGGSTDTFVVQVRLGPETEPGARLVTSTLIGGNGEEVDFNGTFSHDAWPSPDGRVTVAFQTTSNNLPLAGAAVQRRILGAYDAYVAILDPSRDAADQIIYGTYLGGSDHDAPKNVRWLDDHRVAALGWTWSQDFPRTEGLGIRGSNDVWVTVLDIRTTEIAYSTTFGGTAWDTPTEALVTPDGDLLVAGRTGSGDFPAMNAMSPFGAAEADDALVFLFRPGSGATDPGQLLFSSSYGGSGTTSSNDYATGLEIEAAGTYLGTGYTGATDFPTTAGVVQGSHGGGPRDIFITRFDLRFPAPAFTATPLFGSAPLEVDLDASASTPAGGAAVTGYHWDFGDGETGDGRTAAHTYDESDLGRRLVTLTIENDLGVCASAQESVSVHLATTDAEPWHGRDVGEPGFPGGSRPFVSGATDDFLLAAGGRDLAGIAPQFHFLHREMEGDFSLSAHVEDLAEAPTVGTHLGLMLRESLAGGNEVRHFTLAVTRPGVSGPELKTLWRAGTAGSIGHADLDALRGWLRLERRGDQFTSWTSVDGQTWTPLLAEPVTIPGLPARLFVGAGAAKFDRTAATLGPFLALRARISRLEARPLPGSASFRRSDVNADGELNISDPIALLGFLFLGGEAPSCDDAADADDNGKLELTDAIYALGFLFLGDSAPPEPFADCGTDATNDEIPCDGHGPCEG